MLPRTAAAAPGIGALRNDTVRRRLHDRFDPYPQLAAVSGHDLATDLFPGNGKLGKSRLVLDLQFAAAFFVNSCDPRLYLVADLYTHITMNYER